MAEPVVVAFLQNMWFKDPERAKKILALYEKREPLGDGRQRFIRNFLFFGCLTGKRLDEAFEPVFGDEWRWLVTWEETSLEIGGYSSSVFPPDPGHIRGVLNRYQPDFVLAFGSIAQHGLTLAGGTAAITINLPHPAARYRTVKADLAAGAIQLRDRLALWRSLSERFI